MRSFSAAGVLLLALVQQIGVNALIQQLGSGDAQAVSSASAMLKERGDEVLPTLMKALKDTPSCRLQYAISNVVRSMQPDSPVPNATLLGIAQSKCKEKPPQDAQFRRAAAFGLATRTEGVPIVVSMLQSGDTAYRHTGALAFEDVAEGLATGTPKIELTADYAVAAKTIIASMGKTLSDGDVYMHCAAFEGLTNAAKIDNDDLKQQAAKLIEGVTRPKCPAK